jgi:hypothetical protein
MHTTKKGKNNYKKSLYIDLFLVAAILTPPDGI